MGGVVRTPGILLLSSYQWLLKRCAGPCSQPLLVGATISPTTSGCVRVHISPVCGREGSGASISATDAEDETAPSTRHTRCRQAGIVAWTDNGSYASAIQRFALSSRSLFPALEPRHCCVSSLSGTSSSWPST